MRCWQYRRLLSSGGWTSSGFSCSLFIIFIDRISHHSQAVVGGRFWGLQDCVPAVCRWNSPAGLIELKPPALTGAVCSWVWSSMDVNQDFQIWGHGPKLSSHDWESFTKWRSSWDLVHKWIKVSSAVIRGSAQVCCGEEWAQPKDTDLSLLVLTLEFPLQVLLVSPLGIRCRAQPLWKDLA